MRSIQGLADVVLFLVLVVAATAAVSVWFGIFGGLAWKVAQWVQ